MIPRSVRALLGRGVPNIDSMEFTAGGDVAEDIIEKYGFDGDLLRIFAENSGSPVHKWHHYIPIYDRYFSRFRGTPVRFLELGVFKGGSLAMWRKYLGPDAIIYGIDLNPECAQYDGRNGSVRIGSQSDPEFLKSVVEEMGGVDVVLDDGSHLMPHIKISLNVLFPKLSEGGVYFIEDLHTAYWKNFGGGYSSAGNFFQYVRELTDDMHRWHHLKPMKHPEIAESCSAIHVHDSIVVLEKAKVFPPRHSQVG